MDLQRLTRFQDEVRVEVLAFEGVFCEAEKQALIVAMLRR
jgi:hypothetical protein